MWTRLDNTDCWPFCLFFYFIFLSQKLSFLYCVCSSLLFSHTCRWILFIFIKKFNENIQNLKIWMKHIKIWKIEWKITKIWKSGSWWNLAEGYARLNSEHCCLLHSSSVTVTRDPAVSSRPDPVDRCGPAQFNQSARAGHDPTQLPVHLENVSCLPIGTEFN